jgi:hypothetical protein
MLEYADDERTAMMAECCTADRGYKGARNMAAGSRRVRERIRLQAEAWTAYLHGLVSYLNLRMKSPAVGFVGVGNYYDPVPEADRAGVRTTRSTLGSRG